MALFVLYCRMIQKSFIDMESMFELFEEVEEVLFELANDCTVFSPVYGFHFRRCIVTHFIISSVFVLSCR